MTAAGIASVQIARYHLSQQDGLTDKLNKKARKAIYDGVAWLQENYGQYPVKKKKPKPRRGHGHFYDLYGIERAMM